MELKSIIEVKNVYAVINGILNWDEFIEPFRANGTDIPLTILDELLDLALSEK